MSARESPTVSKEFLDGPKLARWIKENRPVCNAEMGENFNRALYRWEHENTQPNYYEIDHYLVKLNIFEYEIPRDFWVKKRPNRVTKSEDRMRAEQYFSEGYHLTEIRAMMKEREIPYKTIHNWWRLWREANE